VDPGKMEMAVAELDMITDVLYVKCSLKPLLYLSGLMKTRTNLGQSDRLCLIANE
jgi:hypothetical protein